LRHSISVAAYLMTCLLNYLLCQNISIFFVSFGRKFLKHFLILIREKFLSYRLLQSVYGPRYQMVLKVFISIKKH